MPTVNLLKPASPFNLVAFVLTAVFLIGQLSAAETETAVAVDTAGGSRIVGMIDATKPWLLRGETGAMTPLDFIKIKRITFGARVDPNIENEARLALGDLQSDQFAVREKALSTLRGLGRAALGPLRRAMQSGDAEEANRASALITEMNAENSADNSLDRVTLTDGSELKGTLSALELLLRSRWGRITIPFPAIEAVDILTSADIRLDQLVAGSEPPVAISQTAAPALSKAAERWAIQDAANPAAAVAPGGAIEQLLGVRSVTMQRIPDPKAPDDKRNKTIEIKDGETLDNAYAAWGILLRSAQPGQHVLSSNTPVLGVSEGLSASATGADLDIKFVIPGSFAVKNGEGREGGVSAIGAFVKGEHAGTIGLAAYDRSGRLLAQILNQADSNLQAGGFRRDEFLGVRSKVPIVRARFFRAGEAPNRPADTVIDDVVFDRIISVERPSDRSCVWLSSGERIAGVLEKSEADAIWIRPEFLDPKAPPRSFAPTEIDRYEPPLFLDPDKAARITGTPHSVLLQNGECFRARLHKLDEQSAMFILPGGVELSLPRGVIRKVDLMPEKGEPGEVPPPTTIKDDEKASVELKSKDEQTGDKKPPKKEPDPAPKIDPKTDGPPPNLAHMENAEVVEVDPAQGTATIRDEDGDMPVGLPLIKWFVYNRDPNVGKAAHKFRDWVLTLREGSRFDIFLLAITPEYVKAEMAGGEVALPSSVIESIQRRKK